MPVIHYKCDACNFKDSIDVQTIANPREVREEMDIRHDTKSGGKCAGKLVQVTQAEGIFAAARRWTNS